MEKWFTQAITDWYKKNKRDLPWRRETDAYKIWLSEIILQQTQVHQGMGYYLRFTETFPTVKHLARAAEDEVLRLWQGLGYYSRARNLHSSAKQIMELHQGSFPDTYTAIRELKGVGDYTAAAIASFAYNLPYAVVDGNVYRLLSRVFGIETPIDTSAAKKQFQQLAGDLLNTKQPALHNQAIMEFGSQYCKPVNPVCETCVLANKCFAFKNDRVSTLPVKAKKTKVRNRYFNYLVLFDKHKNILIRKRGASDIWEGLYEFILLESEREIKAHELQDTSQFRELGISSFTIRHVSKSYKHVLSHQHLFAVFYVIQTETVFKDKWPAYKRIKMDAINQYPFPRLTGKFLDDCDLKEIL